MKEKNESVLSENSVIEQTIKEEKNSYTDLNKLEEFQENKRIVPVPKEMTPYEEKKENLTRILSRKREEVKGNMPIGYKKGFTTISDDLQSMIEMTAADSGYAPRFKRVRTLAQAYLAVKNVDQNLQEPDDNAAAAALAALYVGLIQYLTDRKENSSLERKVLSERMISEIEDMMITVQNPEYLKQVDDLTKAKSRAAFARRAQKKEGEKRDPNLFFDHNHALKERIQKYYGVDTIKEAIKLKEKKKNGDKTLPPTLKDIDNLAENLKVMKDGFIPNMYKDEKQFNDDITGAGLMFTIAYNKYMDTLKRYIAYNEERKPKDEVLDIRYMPKDSLKNPGKPDLYRLDECKDKLVEAENELHTLHNAITEYLSEHDVKKAKSDVKWSTMLKKQGQVRVTIDNKTKNVGAGTSVVYLVHRNENKKQYIKPNDIMPDSAVKLWEETYDDLSLVKNYDKDTADELNKFMHDNLLKDLKGNLSNKDRENGEWKLAKNLRDAADEYAEFNHKRNFLEDILNPNYPWDYFVQFKEHIQKKYNIDLPMVDYLYTLRDTKTPKQKSFIKAVLKDFSKKLLGYRIGRGRAQIAPGGTLAGRNVAISRLAHFFGMSKSVPRSEFAMVDIKGKKSINLIMDDAGGERPYDLDLKGKTGYSPAGATSVIKMMLFDGITCQVDRHWGNYMAVCSEEGDKKYIDNVRLIDNDMCLGSVKGSKILKNKDKNQIKLLQLNLLDETLIYALPQEEKDMLMNYDFNLTKVLLGDILNDDQIESLHSRIKNARFLLEHKVQPAMQSGLLSPDENERRHFELLRDNEEYRTTWYILEKMKEAKTYKNKAGQPLKLHDITCFREEFVGTEAELEAKLDAFRKNK